MDILQYINILRLYSNSGMNSRGEVNPRINQELKSLVPPLSPEDDKELDESIKQHGQWKGFPITISPDGDICDGINRFEKLKKYKKEIDFVVDYSLDDIHKKKLFVIQNVLSRRHLNNWQKGQLGLKLIELSGAQHCAPGTKASEIIASQVPGLKARTFEKIIKIDAEANQKIRTALDRGTMSVNTAYKLVTRLERNLPKVKLPSGEWDVIVGDMPIGFDDEGARGSAESHYPTMTPEQLMRLKIPSSKNAVIFSWIPNAFLIDGTSNRILSKWGFKSVAAFVWTKDKFGNGSWNRNQHENLILAVKGKMPTPAKLYSSVIEAVRTEHSRKPDIIFEMVMKMYPGRKYLELWSRKEREGWTVHGNQVEEIEAVKMVGTVTNSLEKKSTKAIDRFRSKK
jgi:N6-adenosine-specific RNA methylase IME4